MWYGKENRQKRVKEAGEGVKNGTKEEENDGIGLVPIIAAIKFVQDG